MLEIYSDELEHFIRSKSANIPSNWPFSKENRGLITDVSLFIKSHTAECDDISLTSMWQTFIAWSIVQRTAREILWSFPIESEMPSRWRLEEAEYYCKYSVGIYGKSLVSLMMNSKYADLFKSISTREILTTYAGVLDNDILHLVAESQSFLPVHAVCIDHAQKAIVLVVRGTLSLTDCLTDLKAEYVPYELIDPFTGEVRALGTVHEGIFRGAQNLTVLLKVMLLESLAMYPGYSLIATGHSLGAGTVAMLGLLWSSDPDIAPLGYRIYAYGPPCIVSSELHPFTKSHTTSVSLGTDLVTRMCFGTLKDLVSVLLFFKAREGVLGKLTASQIVKMTLTNQPIDQAELISIYLQAKCGFTNLKHHPPGAICQIYDKSRNPDHKLLPASESRFVSEYAHPTFYQEVVFSRTILTDHMPDMYERALSGLIRP